MLLVPNEIAVLAACHDFFAAPTSGSALIGKMQIERRRLGENRVHAVKDDGQ